MSMGSYFLLIGLAAVATWLTRFPALALGRGARVPARLARGLQFVPAGVFTAMIAPAIALHRNPHGGIDWAYDSAVVVALLVALWTKKPLWTMISGVLTVAVLHGLGF